MSTETTLNESFNDSHVLDPAATALSQEAISAEITDIHAAYRQSVVDGAKAATQPRIDFAPYRSSLLRHPTKNLHHTDPDTIDLHSPAFGDRAVPAREPDLALPDRMSAA